MPVALAVRLALEAANPSAKASGSTARRLCRAMSCSAPHVALDGSNGRCGITPRSPAASPVRTYDPVTSHAVFVMTAGALAPLMACAVLAYSANAPNDL